MLTGLRIFLLLTLILCIYSFFTNNLALTPYIQIGFSCSFILLGINERKEGRKPMSIPYFGIAALIFFVMISKFFH